MSQAHLAEPLLLSGPLGSMRTGDTYRLSEDLMKIWAQGRTGTFLVAVLPHHEGILGLLLAGLSLTDVCERTMDFVKMPGLSHPVWAFGTAQEPEQCFLMGIIALRQTLLDDTYIRAEP